MIAKSYRPISLLNTLGKALESILAQRIAHAIEKYRLLPKGHIGGRKGMSTKHALHGLVERVYQAWNMGHVASLLLLDVSGAFDQSCICSIIRTFWKMPRGRILERQPGDGSTIYTSSPTARPQNKTAERFAECTTRLKGGPPHTAPNLISESTNCSILRGT